jgi:uncharacterized protein (TIGR02646 family)
MWQFQRRETIVKPYYVQKWEDLYSSDKREFKNTLIKEFQSRCYFTTRRCNLANVEDFNIEHFVPRNKDKTSYKYDFDYNNLFLCDWNYNSWKGNKVDRNFDYDVSDFEQWLEFINNFDEYFEYQYPYDYEIKTLKKSELKIKLVSKNKKPEVERMIKILKLNDYLVDGMTTLAQKRYLQTLTKQ